MSAFSGGRLLSINDAADLYEAPVATDALEAQAPADPPVPSAKSTDDQTTSALSTIVKTIPGDGIALYISFYSFFIAFADYEKPTTLNLIIGFGLLALAVAGTAAFAIAGALPGYRRLRSKAKKAARRRQIALTALLYSALCVVYIAASPLNPFLLYWNLPLFVGAVAAVAAVALMAFVRNLLKTAKG